MTSDPQAPDRRDFFRIKDRIGLEYHCLRQPAADDDPFRDEHLDGLKSELKRLDQDFRNQLPLLAERDRLAASLLKLLNGKIETLARIMAFEQNPLQPQHWQEATLSEGGVSFPATAGELTVGDVIALRLTLPPELYQPRARAQVVDLTRPQDPHCTGVEEVHTTFTGITDADRQQIAKHVMRWQIRQRQGGDPPQ